MVDHLVVLVGHGAVPTDVPRDLVVELKRLEGERRRRPGTPPCERERGLDRRIREWPRTAATDPYQVGLESIATALASLIAPRPLAVAYNEFCAPSVADVLERAATDGTRRVTVLTTMVTPGGSHADGEIPATVADVRQRHPHLHVDYAWPYDPAAVAAFFAGHLERRLNGR